MVGDIDSNDSNELDTVFYLSVRNSYGEVFNTKIQMSSNAPISNLLECIDHIMDHFTRNHTKIGSLSNALGDSHRRSRLLEMNAKSLKSKIIDAGFGETMIQF